MAVRTLFRTASGMTGVKSISVREGYSQATVTAEVTCTGHSLALGDTVADIAMGYSDDNATMITNGIVKEIRIQRPEHQYVIAVHDSLIRAVDFFIVSDNPLAPFTASNVKAEVLVGQLLAMAGLGSYASDSTIFTFGVPKPVPINLVTVWDAVENICNITGFVCYADNAGVVHFKTRKPYIVGGDTPEITLTVGASGTLTKVDYRKSDDKLRNKIVVYGTVGGNIFASASAASPYVPSGFFKAMVVAHELIDNLPAAQSTAAVNLEMFNRLTETLTGTILGKPSIRARDIVRVTEPYTGLSASDWIVYSCNHVLDKSGYSTELTLVR